MVGGPRLAPQPAPGRRGRAAAAAALALYLALALAVTWPWVTDPAGVTFGVTYGDLGSHIGTPAAWAREGRLPWLPGVIDGVDAPEGQPLQWALNLAAAPSLTLLTLLAGAVGGVAANGLLAVAGFTLSAWAMFLLARRLTGRADAAVVAGLAFGFWPYAYATVTQPLGHGWVLVLMAWRMLELLERPTVRNGVLAGAAVALAMWWVQYWLLIAGVGALTLGAVGIVAARRRGALRAALPAYGAAAAPVALLVAGLAAAGVAAGFEGAPERDPGDPSRFSARAAMYLLPHPANPLVGGLTGPVLERRYGLTSSDAVYNPIYVGLTVLALAAVGVVALVRARRRPGAAPVPRVRPLLACVALGAVALAMSAPPRAELLGLSVPMPSALVAEVTTVFRTSARFAHLVMLALAVLAAVGAAVLLRPRSRPVAAAMLCAMGAAVFVDLWGRDPTIGAPQRISVPPTVAMLRELPRGVVATYPLLPQVGDRTGPIFQAVFHRRPIFNGYRQGVPSETRKLGLARLDLPWVPGELAAYGVRYLLVERVGGPGALSTPGLRRLAADDYATLYAVVAAPARNVALARAGFSFVQGDGATAFRYMTARTGELELWADCRRCRRVLRVTAAAVATPRRLVVRDAAGRVLARRDVGLDSTPVAVPVTVARRAVVTLTVDPPPRPIPGDYREAGILVNVRLRLAPPRSTPAGPPREALAR